MKITSLVFLVLLVACNKKPAYDINREYTVEGYLYNRVKNYPASNVRISLTQREMTYNHFDPTTTTDSAGYFKLTYRVVDKKDGVYIYPTKSDYSCIYSDISYIGDLQKGKDLNLGKVYILQ